MMTNKSQPIFDQNMTNYDDQQTTLQESNVSSKAKLEPISHVKTVQYDYGQKKTQRNSNNLSPRQLYLGDDDNQWDQLNKPSF